MTTTLLRFGGTAIPFSVNGRTGLHVEFDSEDTVGNFNTDEWKAFHLAVDQSKESQGILAQCNNSEISCDAARRAQLQEAIGLPKKLFDGDTILTGMFGLDCEHDCKSELHPLYAMATKRSAFENDPADEVWLMFVRNVGNEGYCSSQLWGAQFTRYTFRLPWRDGMTSVDVLWGLKKTQFEGTDGTTGPSVTYIPPPFPNKGVYVTFTLPSPSQSPLIDGTLHLKWTGRPVVIGSDRNSGARDTSDRNTRPSQVLGSPLGVVTDPRSEEIDEAEHKILAAINQLPPAQRQEVQKARKVVSARAALHPLPQGGAVKRITTIAEAPPVIVSRLAVKAGMASRKQEHDAAQMRALCAATNNAPAGLPAEACTSPVRDHR